MSTTQEEAVLRLGLDSGPLTGGLASVKRAASEIGGTLQHNMESANHGILHAVSGTRGLHHAIVEVANVSPMLGNALRFALNPVVLLIVTLAQSMKHLHEEFKELNKVFDEVEKAQRGSAIGAREKLEAQRKSRKEIIEDQRRANKEDAEDNDPVKRMMEGLKRQEEAFDHQKDFAGKMEAQQKALAQIEKDREEARKSTEQYNDAPAAEGRAALIRKKSEAEAFIKTSEEYLRKQKEIQNKTREAFEEQEKIDQGSFAGKAMHFGDTVRQQKAEQYRQAVSMEESYQRSIDKTRDSVDKLDEKLKDGLETHQETHKRLRELESAHNAVSAAIARSQKEAEAEQRQRDKLSSDILRAKEQVQDERLAAFMPAAKDLAESTQVGTAPGESAAIRMFNFQKELDDREFSRAKDRGLGTYEAQFAGKQRELERTEDDARRAFLLEGPESQRFKTDEKQIEVLKKELADAGFQKHQNHMEAVRNHLKDLLELAQIHGLKIEPVNGK